MTERLDQVITTNPGGFTPEYPRRAPWHQPHALPIHVAVTATVATVPLKHADTVHLTGLADQLRIADPWDMLPEDMTRQSWGLPAA